MKKIKFIGKLLFFINVLVAFATIFAFCAPYVSPESFWPFAFFGLALPYLLISNLIFILYWLLRANSRFILSLIIFALAYKSIPSFIQMELKSPEITEKDIKVMSFNVRVFDLYMWTETKTTRNQIFDFLDKEQPDILCLQEFYHTDVQYERYEFKTLDTLIKILNAKNYHFHYTATRNKNDHWGLITFSKFPIVEKGVVDFNEEGDNACMYSDLLINNKNIRVYNSHLASIKLGKHDYKAMRKINDDKELSEDLKEEVKLVKKIKYGFKKRASQAEAMQENIDSSPYPVIVCGDFNDTPSSYSYQTIRGNLKDAFMESGSGLGQTYIGEFPSFRIDYIFYDEQFDSKLYTTHQVVLSDHKPISTFITLP